MNSSLSANATSRLTGEHAHAFTSPDRLAVVATLHGMSPRDPDVATVVELGPGRATNLLALAARAPNATFIGVEADATQRAEAVATARQLGLDNLHFADAAPPADYLIATDFDGDLRLIERALAPGGVAVIGFETEVGASDVAPLRDLMRHHVASVDPTLAARQAREIAAWHVARMGRLHGEPRVALLRAVLAEIAALDDPALLRWLARRPLATQAFEDAGLVWLRNARMHEAPTSALPEAVQSMAKQQTMLRRQRYLDYFLMPWRRTVIVCRASESIVRAVAPSAFRPFAIAGRVALRKLTAPPFTIATNDASVTLSSAASALLVSLAEHVPAAVPVTILLDRVPSLSDEVALTAIAELWQADVVELSLRPPALAASVPPSPRTPALQRYLAQAGRPAISLWHREWPLDAAERATLAALDGTPREAFTPEVLAGLVHKGFITAE